MIWFGPHKSFGVDENEDSSWFVGRYPVDPIGYAAPIWTTDELTLAQVKRLIYAEGLSLPSEMTV